VPPSLGGAKGKTKRFKVGAEGQNDNNVYRSFPTGGEGREEEGWTCESGKAEDSSELESGVWRLPAKGRLRGKTRSRGMGNVTRENITGKSEDLDS